MLLVTAAPAPERLGDFYLANTVQLAAGTNTVNTILVDFRGFDTLGAGSRAGRPCSTACSRST